MRKIILSIIIIIIVLIFIWWRQNRQEAEPLEGDTTTQINQQLESLGLGQLDSEFQGIDSELNNL